MTSRYVVVQFGNLLTGEFLNIGIMTYADEGDERVRSRFIRDLTRIRAAFGEDFVLEGWLKDYGPRITTKSDLEKFVAGLGPYSSLQVTEPRASLLDPDALLEDIAPTFLVEPRGL